MKFIFAGIGSRQTPVHIQEVMIEVCKELANRGFTLRSGGAAGADKACECGCDEAHGQKEIYLPWPGFNDHPSHLHSIDPEAIELARIYHPAPHRLTAVTEKMMGRNSYQVLGRDLMTPSDFILCYTNDGKASGGTGQALRIAKDRGIPIFNLYDGDALANLRSYIIGKIGFTG